MHLSVELHYAAPVGDIARMLADESFVRWRAERTGGPHGAVDQVDVTGSPDDGFAVVVRRTLPTDEIPAHVRGFVGSSLEVRQTEVWEPEIDGRRRGTVTLEITGAPVRLTGTTSLTPTADGGAVHAYVGDIKAAVPLFGGAIEAAAGQAVRSTLLAEEAAGREWLASH